MKIYLAHNGKYKNKGKELQEILESKGYTVLNPFDTDEYACLLTKLWDNYPHVRKLKDIASLIVEKDLLAIDKCDVLVAYMIEPSIGSSMEIFYASFAKPVFILSKLESPWLIKHGTVVETVEELLDCLEEAQKCFSTE